MSRLPPVLRLELQPERRHEVTDLRPLVEAARRAGQFSGCGRLLCLSHHTTAGFPDLPLRRRLGSSPARLEAFLEALRHLFPREAGYHHDQLDRRSELSEGQRQREPLNADAHLAFIGGGFTNAAFHPGGGTDPIWLVDFDGVYEGTGGEATRRQRSVTVIGVEGEELVQRLTFEIPAPEGPAALRLDAPELGILGVVEDSIARGAVKAGQVRLRLTDAGPGAGLTVNEAEALLMDRDLVEVLQEPLRFARDRNGRGRGNGTPASEAGRGASGEPSPSGEELARPAGHPLGLALEALQASPARRERILDRALESPARRILRIRRECSLGILPSGDEAAPGNLLLGRYQSPILVQQEAPAGGIHRISVHLVRFLR